MGLNSKALLIGNYIFFFSQWTTHLNDVPVKGRLCPCHGFWNVCAQNFKTICILANGAFIKFSIRHLRISHTCRPSWKPIYFVWLNKRGKSKQEEVGGVSRVVVQGIVFYLVLVHPKGYLKSNCKPPQSDENCQPAQLIKSTSHILKSYSLLRDPGGIS